MSKTENETPIHVGMIAAVARNNVIGKDQGMPWRLPSDMAFFKKTTMGKPIVMGRKQFETVGKPLPGRVNIVVSRQPGYQPEGVLVISDFTAALDHAKSIARAEGGDEVMIIGGGEIYKLGLPFADRLYITHVDAAPDGDTFFPQVDWDAWSAIKVPEVVATELDSSSFAVRIYHRTGSTH